MTGLVKRTEDERGFCLIAPLIGKPGEAGLVFCHVSQCPNGMLPPQGCEVEFELVRYEGGNGTQAANVRLRTVSQKRLFAAPEGPEMRR